MAFAMASDGPDMVADLVKRSPGMVPTAVRARLVGRSNVARDQAIRDAVEAGVVHFEPAYRSVRGGALRSVPALFPGPAEAPTNIDGAAVRKWRARYGLSQPALAGHLGVSQALVSRWETGALATPLWLPGKLEQLEGQLKPYRRRPKRRPLTPKPVAVVSPEQLDELLEEAGWTPAQVARALGVSDTSVSMWRSGGRPLRGARAEQAIRALGKAGTVQERVAAEVARTPGVTREQLTRGGLGRGKAVAEALDELIEARQVHHGSRLAMVGSTATRRYERTVVGLYPGPPSPQPAPLPGRELERLRRQAGLSRNELARRARVSKTLVAAWEHGQTAVPLSRVQELRQLVAPAGARPAAPYADPVHHSDAELRRALVATIAARPGRPGRQVVAEVAGTTTRKYAQLAAAEAAGEVHRQPVALTDARERTYHHHGYFPGGGPAAAGAPRYSDAELVDLVAAVVAYSPGLTTLEVVSAEGMHGDTARRRRAVKAAEDAGRIVGVKGAHNRTHWHPPGR